MSYYVWEGALIETCAIAASSTAGYPWTVLGSTPGVGGEKPFLVMYCVSASLPVSLPRLLMLLFGVIVTLLLPANPLCAPPNDKYSP